MSRCTWETTRKSFINSKHFTLNYFNGNESHTYFAKWNTTTLTMTPVSIYGKNISSSHSQTSLDAQATNGNEMPHIISHKSGKTHHYTHCYACTEKAVVINETNPQCSFHLHSLKNMFNLTPPLPMLLLCVKWRCSQLYTIFFHSSTQLDAVIWNLKTHSECLFRRKWRVGVEEKKIKNNELKNTHAKHSMNFRRIWFRITPVVWICYHAELFGISNTYLTNETILTCSTQSMRAT